MLSAKKKSDGEVRARRDAVAGLRPGLVPGMMRAAKN